jgi:hypothetical protein
MDDIKNQWIKIVITTGLLLLITFLGELFVYNISSELSEANCLLWMFVLIPAIIIAIIGAIVYLVKNAPAYRSFFRVVFRVWLILHIIWSVFSIWFYISLSSVRWQ